MNTHDEIAALKRRIGGLEYELGQIKTRIAEIEAESTSAAAPAAGVVPSTTSEALHRTPLPLPLPLPVPAPTPAPVASASPPRELPPVLPALPPPVLAAKAPVVTGAHEEPAPSPLREWLEPLQLWPPSGEEDTEVRLAAWWATRMGALLAVIGVVFLGIYVSRDAAPWVRLAEVSAVTAGVLALGSWLERKLPKFGSVVFGAGLALAYFCAFAAYAVAPMKVIDTPLAAMGCELIVVAGILGIAWWRNAPVVATMAVALGHVTAFLALRHGLGSFGPWVVLTLSAAAVWLRFARAWDAPSVVAMPLAWLFLGAALFPPGRGGELGLAAAWVWTALYFALFMARDWLIAWRGETLSTGDRVLQVTSSALAVAVSLAAAARVGDAALTQFYFGSAAVMLAATWAWQRVRAQALVPIFVCKTAALLALGVIAQFDGHARYLVLLAQAFVMLESARRSHVRGLRTMTFITAAVALTFYLFELGPYGAPMFTGATLAAVAFLLGAVTFLGAARRALYVGAIGTAIASAVTGVAAVVTIGLWQTNGWSPAVHVGLAALIVGAATLSRAWRPASITAGIVIMAGHVEMALGSAMRFPETRWLNELVLLAAALAAGWATSSTALTDAARTRLRLLIAAVSLTTLVVVFFQAMAAGAALCASAGLALVLVAAATRLRGWPFVALSTPVLVFGCLLYVERAPPPTAWLGLAALAAWALPVWLAASPARAEAIASAEWRQALRIVQTLLATVLTLAALQGNLHGDARLAGTALAAIAIVGLTWWPGLRAALEASWVLWLGGIAIAISSGASVLGWASALVVWAPALMLKHVGAVQPLKAPPPPWRSDAEGIQIALATLLGATVALNYHGAQRLVALGAVIAIAWATWHWGRIDSARIATLVLAGATWLAAMSLATTSEAQGWGSPLTAVLTVALLVAVLPLSVERGLETAARKNLRAAGAAAAVVLSFFVFFVQRGAVAPYATVGCGVAGVATFLIGLFARSRAHRLCGLAGLALCIPRAFIVDLDSTLHRIAAFVVLGVVLLWVGFSYQRFRHLIGDEEKKL